MEKKVAVRNRTEGIVSYAIPSLRILRTWNKVGDILYIPKEELIEALTIPGGRYTIEHLLVIEDTEVRLEVLGREMEPEYFYSEKEIDSLLHGGSIEQFLDCLDYAPDGVLSLIKEKSIRKLPDSTAKIEAINRKFKISLNVLHNNYSAQDDEGVKTEEISGRARRAQPIGAQEVEKPKVPTYNVTNR